MCLAVLYAFFRYIYFLLFCFSQSISYNLVGLIVYNLIWWQAQVSEATVKEGMIECRSQVGTLMTISISKKQFHATKVYIYKELAVDIPAA